MARAVRRCFKKEPNGKYTVGKMCNKLGAKNKFASGKARKKPPLRSLTVVSKKTGKPDMRFKANYMKGIKRK